MMAIEAETKTEPRAVVTKRQAEFFEFVRQPACALCGGEARRPFETISNFHDKSFVWSDIEFHYAICESCGFVYMDPVPTAESYQQFYRDYYWYIQTSVITKAGQDGIRDRERIERARERSIENLRARRIPRITRMIEEAGCALDERSRVLEVGCAWGTTLDHLNRRFGAQTYGIEPSEQALEYIARNSPGIRIIGRTAEDVFDEHLWDGQMDLIIFSHCLEMIMDQNRAFAMIRRLLSPQGMVYIDTPNLYWQRALNPCHPYIYSEATLSAWLAKHGLAVRSVMACPEPQGGVWPALGTFRRSRDPYLTVMAVAGAARAPVLRADAAAIRQKRELAQRAVWLAQAKDRAKDKLIGMLWRAKRKLAARIGGGREG